jgi:lipopolysaccharide transport system ATP-binding protein
MASDVAIRVENLSKKFRIGTGNSPAYHRLSEALTGIPRMAWNSLFPPRPEPMALAAGSSLQPPASSLHPVNDFWALKDVSFEVKQGEVVGIIGRNGAGKSTLLKILSRITEPTSGRFGVRGRVASLLEVGTGFHPELTGRENIFVSGITLGMTRAEINKRFDEIVDFSGVEKFLDTPAKHYSSGMQVRLGFAVAAHLESEVLIVDEVLAVGDAEFQKKCMGKMSAVATSGRSILFVSHNPTAIRLLCQNCILLNNGSVQQYAQTPVVLASYQYRSQVSDINYEALPKPIGDETARLCRARIRHQGDETSGCPISSPIQIEMEYEILKDQARVFPNFHIKDINGNCVFVTADIVLDPESNLKVSRGRYRACCTLPGNFLNNESYQIGVALTSRESFVVHFFQPQDLHITVVEPLSGAITRVDGYVGAVPGAIRPVLDWKSEKLQ